MNQQKWFDQTRPLASLLQQKAAAPLVQFDHLVLVGQLEQLLHVEGRDRLVGRVDHLQHFVYVVEALFWFQFRNANVVKVTACSLYARMTLPQELRNARLTWQNDFGRLFLLEVGLEHGLEDG